MTINVLTMPDAYNGKLKVFMLKQWLLQNDYNKIK